MSSPETDSLFGTLEAQRRAAIKAAWRAGGICLLLVPLAIAPVAGMLILMIEHPAGTRLASVAQSGQEMIGPYGMHVFMGSLVWLLVGLYLIGRFFVHHGRRPAWNYVRDFKGIELNHVCKTHFPGLSYDPDGYIGYTEFDATKLFAHSSDVYRSEDYFSGRVGRTDVYFAEVKAERERTGFHRGKIRTYYEELFRGLVFVADFHKHFHSTTRLLPRDAKATRVRGQEPVVMEDPDFEETFVTVSTDQVDARYVLSSSMVQRFVNLSRRFPGMRALFDNDRLVLVLPSSRNRFEPSLYRPARSSWQIDQFVRDIQSLFRIVEELDLNTRIWSKV